MVSSVERAARLLSVPEDRLAGAIRAAQVERWGLDAQRRPVYAWERLLELARSPGVQPPATLDPDRRRHTSPFQVRRERGRRNRHRKSSSGRSG